MRRSIQQSINWSITQPISHSFDQSVHYLVDKTSSIEVNFPVVSLCVNSINRLCEVDHTLLKKLQADPRLTAEYLHHRPADSFECLPVFCEESCYRIGQNFPLVINVVEDVLGPFHKIPYFVTRRRAIDIPDELLLDFFTEHVLDTDKYRYKQ